MILPWCVSINILEYQHVVSCFFIPLFRLFAIILKTKVYAIVFIFVLLTPVISVYLLMHTERFQIQAEVSKKIIPEISTKEITVLQFSIEEHSTLLDWKKPHEFEYAGEMYDVVKKIQSKDSVTYLCYHDKKETRLNKQFAQLLNTTFGNDLQKKKDQKVVSNFFQLVYLSPAPVRFPKHLDQIQSLLLKVPLFADRFLKKPPTPPPQFAWALYN